MPKDRHSGSAGEFVKGICKKPWNVSKAHPSVPGPVTRTGKEGPEGHRRHREPQLGPGRSESPLRALLTSLEPRGLRAASRGTRCPQGGGWGRAPARRTAPSPDSAPPLPQSKRWRTRKLPRTGTDFRANRAAALAFSGGSDAIGSCGRRAEMSKVKVSGPWAVGLQGKLRPDPLGLGLCWAGLASAASRPSAVGSREPKDSSEQLES
ncbi:PREDICTED: uncharacterized protein LOC108529864 [Rhinopithecus bieti]|uniref:uncharacterized protein LOC108529864 n=1 Tax=Rhinopithecus bieti TaxID=61621 RepID=UPI00083BB064|nr:PREDICTED: uncharacterized protein LOC108529864 [Rhinopithecus bieti]